MTLLHKIGLDPATIPAYAKFASIQPDPAVEPKPAPRSGWLSRLAQGLRKTGSGIAQVFTGTRIDEALYEDLESALLLADAGLPATQFLLTDLKRRVKECKATDPAAVKALLADALAEEAVQDAADTFRAAAREQLAVWAGRNQVEIVSQEGGDPAAVTFDAVSAGRARGCDVVIADTAGRLPTQVHLMEELKKIQRTIGKAMPGAPHEVLLVVDGNTGQNALAQVKAFDAALGLTGLIVTKLDGTAKGGVLAAIARWGAEQGRVVPVYFIGIGEKLEDLQTFDAREFAQALLG